MTTIGRLDATDLALMRGSRMLFEALSFGIDAGRALVLRGPNGAGKTSLLRIVAGLTRPDRGTVAFDGRAVPPHSAARRTRTLYLGHLNAIKDELTAEENLATALALDGLPADGDTVRHSLARVGLSHARRVAGARLSQGQKRRIGLARLGIGGRALWLLDEPTNALDVDGVALFASLVDAHLAAGGMALMATHLDLPLASAPATLTLSGPST